MTTPPHSTSQQPAGQIARRIGMVLFLAFLGLVVVGMLIREPMPGDRFHVIVRWPLWVVLGVGGPLLLVRLALWRRRRRPARRPPAVPGP